MAAAHQPIKNKILFSFSQIKKSDIEKEIRSLNSKKATPLATVPAKLLKITSNVSSSVLHKLFNEMVNTDIFLDFLKKADVTPAHKKKKIL